MKPGCTSAEGAPRGDEEGRKHPSGWPEYGACLRTPVPAPRNAATRRTLIRQTVEPVSSREDALRPRHRHPRRLSRWGWIDHER